MSQTLKHKTLKQYILAAISELFNSIFNASIYFTNPICRCVRPVFHSIHMQHISIMEKVLYSDTFTYLKYLK